MTNHRPTVRGDDAAIWRRMVRLPFDHAVPVERRDPDLDAKLDAEASGILAWMVAGAMKYLKERRLGTCPVVEAASLAYRAEQDVIGAFITDCVELGPEMRVARPSFYQAYVNWCSDEGRSPWTRKALKMALEERGLAIGELKTNGKVYLTGIGLLKPIREYDY